MFQSLIGTVQPHFHGNFGGAFKCKISFQSLIGTVQPWMFIGILVMVGMFQSLIGTVQLIIWKIKKGVATRFQSLIGTVQQQCLLRFMFSLYLISTVFQSFSPKKSVNLFIENSRKALA